MGYVLRKKSKVASSFAEGSHDLVTGVWEYFPLGGGLLQGVAGGGLSPHEGLGLAIRVLPLVQGGQVRTAVPGRVPWC